MATCCCSSSSVRRPDRQRPCRRIRWNVPPVGSARPDSPSTVRSTFSAASDTPPVSDSPPVSKRSSDSTSARTSGSTWRSARISPVRPAGGPRVRGTGGGPDYPWDPEHYSASRAASVESRPGFDKTLADCRIVVAGQLARADCRLDFHRLPPDHSCVNGSEIRNRWTPGKVIENAAQAVDGPNARPKRGRKFVERSADRLSMGSGH